MNCIVEEIKKLSDEQRFLRTQVKTVHLNVERKVPSNIAINKRYSNRRKLRHLFYLYDQLRGKELVPFKKAEFSTYYLDKLKSEYGLKKSIREEKVILTEA